VEFTASLVQLLSKSLNLLAHILFKPKEPLNWFILTFGLRGIEDPGVPKHRLLDLLGDHGTDLAQILSDLLNFLGGTIQKLEVGRQSAS